ncbi:MAG: AsmA family protein [Myxococcales bacterium]|nr:AsmA family protein [Myxococcales bacterium]
MSVVLRATAALLIVVLAALVVLVVAAPRLLESDAVRAEIVGALVAAVGREVTVEALELQLAPLSVVFVRPRVAGDEAGGAPWVELESLALRIATRPLLDRRVIIDSLVAEGATLRLRRTADGFQWPAPPERTADERPADASQPVPSAPPSFSIAVREVRIRRSKIVLRDEATTPPLVIEFRDIEGHAETESVTAPVEFDLALTLASGGRLQLRGSSTRDAVVDVTADLDDVQVGASVQYLVAGGGTGSADSAPVVGGLATGRVTFRGPASGPSVTADLRLRKAQLAFDEIEVGGLVAVDAALTGFPDAPTGTFALDATAADLRYGGAFTKPPGDEAHVTGRILRGVDGALTVDDVRLEIRDFEAHGRMLLGERLMLALDAPPTEIGGLAALIPPIAPYGLKGNVGLEALVLRTKPLDLRGRVKLQGLVLPVAGFIPVRLDGTVLVDGDALRTRDLVATAAEQEFRVEVDVNDLWGDRNERARVEAEGVDTSAIVSAITGEPARLHGDLALQGLVSGSLSDLVAAIESLNGSVRFDITDGRIEGVSLLQASFDAIGPLGKAAHLVGFVSRDLNLDRFFDGEFESIGGTLKIDDGVITTDDLRAVYTTYEVDLWGMLRLTDLSLDMKGNLTLGGNLVAALGARVATPRVVPLASVRGTLTQPKVEVTPTVVKGFFAALGLPRIRSTLAGVLEKPLRSGAESAGKLLKNLFELGVESTPDP